MHFLLLWAQGYRPGKYAYVLDIYRNPVTQWSKPFVGEGFPGLLRLKRYRPQSELQAYAGTIATRFSQQAPHCIGQAAASCGQQDHRRPIDLVLDNARYQRCTLVPEPFYRTIIKLGYTLCRSIT